MPRNTDEINKLLTATIAELGDNGPENLSIGRVALRAGLPLALVERLYPDMATLLQEAVEHVVERTIVRAIDDLPGGVLPSAQLGIFCERLWAALRLPALGAIYRLAHAEHDRVGAFEQLLGETVLARARVMVRTLLAAAESSGDIRVEDAKRKADRVVNLIFVHGLWHHYPEPFRLFTIESAEDVVPHILLMTLGQEAQARILAAARAHPHGERGD